MSAARESRGAFRSGRVVVLGAAAVSVVFCGKVLVFGTVVLASLKFPDAVGEESTDMEENGVVRGLIPCPRGVVKAAPPNEVPKGAEPNELES